MMMLSKGSTTPESRNARACDADGGRHDDNAGRRAGAARWSALAATVGALAAVTLSGCAVVTPTGPSVVALPTRGEPLAKFQNDDYECRSYAYRTVDPNAAQQNANNHAVNGAALGTLGGAAAGALIGAAGGNAAAGAAIGAGSGLLLGSAVGAGNAQNDSAGLQARYDASYAQCMTAKGNTIQQQAAPVYYAPPPAYYAPPPGPVYYYGRPRPMWW
ncbi:glycine zipper family protein [Robbsia sp. KACC 23696]|uniref:glycine zipper family protein n=1 Tax=Robbsia sp. KACC 23696 TaxID=3149231 RepID=UPI00325B7124